MQQTTVENGSRARDLGQIVRAELAGLRSYFDRGTTRSLGWRLGQLDAIEKFLIEREEDICEALRQDLGKPKIEAFAAEVALCKQEIVHVRKHLRSWMRPERVRSSKATFPGKSYVYREPLGVALIIGPWNYPMQLLIAPLIGAVSAGNCAMVKPSEVSPATSAMLARWLPKYLDTDAVKVMEGGVEETTALLNEKWDHIFYTGNGHVGRIVMSAAAKHLTPVTLELGGKSPCIVDRSANIDVTARRIVFGKFYNAGQTCVAPDYVLVDETVHDALINAMVAHVREFFGDDPEKSPDFGRIINERHYARLMKLIDGANVATGGTGDEAARYIAPTILRDVKDSDPVMRDEIFGPVLPVISVTGVDEAIHRVNERDKPLALYVFSEDVNVQDRVIAQTSAGGTTVNHIWLHLSVPDLPFGGVGESGMGGYHGRDSFETFSHRRSVLRMPTWLDPSLLYPPYTELKQKIIRKLI
ncbi:MAG: aldehyde dehydrogenase family protein [Polyangiales bacterium]